MDKKYSILILGGGVMQIPAITHAKKMGCTVIVADGNPDVPGASLADYFEHVDLKDRDRMTAIADSYRKKGILDGVFTAGTDFSSTVACVAEKLGLPGIPFETAMNATDKGRMRQVFREHDVPCPEFTVVTSVSSISELPSVLSFPLVAKPVDNMGSRGVRRIDTAGELEEAVRAALPLSRTGQVIIEEYIEGPEFSIDALVYNGEIFVCGIADRHIYFPPYFVEMGHTIPSSYPEPVLESVLAVFRQGVRAIGIDNGAAKGDVKYSPHGPLIGEIAARLSGGYMSGWTFPYSSGVHVTAGGIRIALGLHPGNLAPVHNHISAERAFISIPGVVRSIDGLESARSTVHVKDVFIRIKDGTRVTFPTNNVEKCGNIISEAETREEATRASELARTLIFIRLEPGDTATEAFLFTDSGIFPPAAFKIEQPDNSTALSEMPAAIYPASIDRETEVIVMALPSREPDSSRDWHGISFQESLDRIRAVTSVRFSGNEERPDALVLGSVFWRAFLKGSIQGGVWLIDTIRSLIVTGNGMDAVIDTIKRYERTAIMKGSRG